MIQQSPLSPVLFKVVRAAEGEINSGRRLQNRRSQGKTTHMLSFVDDVNTARVGEVATE